MCAKLEILRSQLNALHRENESYSGEYFHFAIAGISALCLDFTEFGDLSSVEDSVEEMDLQDRESESNGLGSC